MTIAATVKIFKTLKYFDNNLKINKEKIDTLDPGDTSKIKRLEREALLVNKYLAIFCFKYLNSKTVHTPEEFKFLITSSKVDKVHITKLNKFFPKMTEKEFNDMLIVYDKLNNDPK